MHPRNSWLFVSIQTRKSLISSTVVLGFSRFIIVIIIIIIIIIRQKVKFTLEQAMKAQRESRSIALLFL